MEPAAEKKIKEIFFDVEWSDFSTPEDLYGLQMTFLSNCNSIDRIRKLLEQYNKNPEIIVDTLILLYNNPEISGIGYFPYKMLIADLEEYSECIERLSSASSSIYLNLLYRIAFRVEFQGYSSYISKIETLLAFKCAHAVFKSDAVWGVERKRVGS